MKVGDLVQVVSAGQFKNPNQPRVVARGILIRDLSYGYFSYHYMIGNSHPFEILCSDGTIFCDWSNTWILEPVPEALDREIEELAMSLADQ